MLIKKTRMHVTWPFQISLCAESNYKPNMHDHLHYFFLANAWKKLNKTSKYELITWNLSWWWRRIAGTWNWSWSRTTDACCIAGGTTVETGFDGLLIRKAVAGTAVVASTGPCGCCPWPAWCVSDRPSWLDGTWSPPILTCSVQTSVFILLAVRIYTHTVTFYLHN